MTLLHIDIPEDDGTLSADRARLKITFDPDDNYLSLSMNGGDEFDFKVDELLRVLNCIFMLKKSDS